MLCLLEVGRGTFLAASIGRLVLEFRRIGTEVVLGRPEAIETLAILQLLKMVQAESNSLADVVECERRHRRACEATGIEFLLGKRCRQIASDDGRLDILRRHSDVDHAGSVTSVFLLLAAMERELVNRAVQFGHRLLEGFDGDLVTGRDQSLPLFLILGGPSGGHLDDGAAIFHFKACEQSGTRIPAAFFALALEYT